MDDYMDMPSGQRQGYGRSRRSSSGGGMYHADAMGDMNQQMGAMHLQQQQQQMYQLNQLNLMSQLDPMNQLNQTDLLNQPNQLNQLDSLQQQQQRIKRLVKQRQGLRQRQMSAVMQKAVTPAAQLQALELGYNELHNFISSRNATFLDVFRMQATNRSRTSSPSRSVGYYPNQPNQPYAQSARGGTIRKTDVSAVVMRCAPGSSRDDMSYVGLLVDAALPRHMAITAEDLSYAVRQGAAIERLVEAGRFPASISALLAGLGDAMISNRTRAQNLFRQLDPSRSGMLSAPQQLELCRSLMRLKHSDTMWLSVGLYMYNGSEGRSGVLTFEELSEALISLADMQGGGYGQMPPSPGRSPASGMGGAYSSGMNGMMPPGSPMGGMNPNMMGGINQGMGAGMGSNMMGGGMGGMGGGGMGMGGMGGGGMGGMNPNMMGGAGMGMGGGGMGMGNGAGMGGMGGGMGGMGAGMGGMGMGNNNAQLYCAWVHDNRQRVLESYFADDHLKKLGVLTDQKQKLDLEDQLKQETLKHQYDITRMDKQLAMIRWKDIAQRVATGEAPAHMMTYKEMEGKLTRALEQAVDITRAKDMATLGAAGTWNPSTGEVLDLDQGINMEGLLDKLTSPEWLDRVALPRNADTLRVAMDVRKKMMELQRYNERDKAGVEISKKEMELQTSEARHAMAMQVQMLQAQLQQRTLELERRIVYDAQQQAYSQQLGLATQQQQVQQQMQPGSNAFLSSMYTPQPIGAAAGQLRYAPQSPTAGSPSVQMAIPFASPPPYPAPGQLTSTHTNANVTAATIMSNPRSVVLSPRTWQLEPSQDYVTTSGMLAAGFRSYSGGGAAPGGSNIVPSPPSDN
eukprot:gene11037-18640_t